MYVCFQAVFPQSLVSDIFGGYLRSSLHQAGAKESANVEPFFDLQLDIQVIIQCTVQSVPLLTEQLQDLECCPLNKRCTLNIKVELLYSKNMRKVLGMCN